MKGAPSSRQGSAELPTADRSALHGLWPWLLWIGGMIVSMGPLLASGLGRVSASRGDPRLIHYALEHSWRWIIRHPLHRSFWDPPIFHPYGDVAAFSDVLLGAGPLYWPWRALGIEPVTAFQLWEAAVWSSGFLCAYLLLRRSLGFGTAAAAVGAYLFAFGNFRLANHAHPQLLPQFAVLLGVAAVAGFFRPGQSPNRRRLWIAAFALAIALQMWTAYYPLFFFGLTAIFAAVAAPIWPDTRHRLLDGLRRHGIALAVGGAAALLLINPLVEKYQDTLEDIGARQVSEELMPRPVSWILPGHRNVLIGGLQAESFDLTGGGNHAGGLGLLTSLLVAAGLWLGRRQATVRLLVAATLALALVSTWYGGWSPWLTLREVIPGATAIRALGRVAMVVLLPAAVGLALAVGALRRRFPGKWGTALTLAVLAVVAAEQLQTRAWVDKAAERDHMARLTERVPDDCPVFYMVCVGPRDCRNAPLDAMWTALNIERPTVNGRYGNSPPGYHLIHARARSQLETRRLRQALDFWLYHQRIDPAGVCWVTQPGFPIRKAGLTRWP